MRADVKLGVVISGVIVLTAGTYYIYRDKRDTPLGLSDKMMASAKTADTPSESPPQAKGRTSRQPGSKEEVHGQTEPSRKEAGRTSTRSAKSPTREQAAPRSNRTAKKPAARDRDGSRGKAGTANQPAFLSSPAAKRAATQPVRSTGGPTGEKAAAPKRAVGKPTETIPSKIEAKSGVAVDTHRVQAGDTFNSLALMYYGSAQYTQFLMDANRQIPDPKRLSVGTLVKIPAAPPQGSPSDGRRLPALPTNEGVRKADTTGKPGSRTAPTYRVKPGDTFYGIARDVLGDASRWKELFELNRELVKGDPKHLQIDQVLELPKS